MATRRTYEEFALIIRTNAADTGPEGKAMARDIARDMADNFGRSNPKFDRARFLAACGF